MAIDLKHNNREKIKKGKKDVGLPAYQQWMLTQPRPWPSVRAVKRNDSVDDLVASRGENVFFFSRSLLDMREDGTDHVLRSWCFQLRRGRCHGRRTLLLDILKVMYIKAELFWFGRCQNTFIWSAKHSSFVRLIKIRKFCSKIDAIGQKMMRVFSGNSLFSRGTTFESSTCDYSDDLQILLESGGDDKKRTNESQTEERPEENVGRQHRAIASFTFEWVHYEKGGKQERQRERGRERGRESGDLATVADVIQLVTDTSGKRGRGGWRWGRDEGNCEWVRTPTPMQFYCQSSMLLTCTCGSNTEHLESFPWRCEDAELLRGKKTKNQMPAAELKCPPNASRALWQQQTCSFNSGTMT